MFRGKFVITLGLIFLLSFLNAQSIDQVDIIFDASGSMWGQIDGVSKIEIARKAMTDLMKDFEEQKDLQLALRVYGHTNKKCDNSKLEIPIGTGNHSAIIEKIKSIKPLGKTPIAFSLEQCVTDFKDAKGEKSIVLITDGLESCDGDICTVAQALKDAGIITKIHIVGFGMKAEEVNSLACIVEPFGGKIIAAGNAGELKEAFRKIVKETVRFNLEIRAKDDDSNNVFVSYVIKNLDGADIKSGDNSIQSVGKESLEPGFYNLYITNNQSGDEIKYSSIEIKQDEVLKIEAIFAQRLIEIQTVNETGENKYCDVYLYDEKGEEIKHVDTSMGGTATINILPGIYSILIFDNETRKEHKIENVDLVKTKEYKKQLILK